MMKHYVITEFCFQILYKNMGEKMTFETFFKAMKIDLYTNLTSIPY